ncbi:MULTISPECIES: hypothetical protein [Nostocales]|uniref:Uncharacterized protein n=1 Tax=Tolypothrix campylonemoides VB511288_2 TaxID=3232311 RepID=A0ABW8XB41_9CYAN|nr:hypothetical protein [Tolypothrix bouteillei]
MNYLFCHLPSEILKIKSVGTIPTALTTFKLPLENNLRSTLSGIPDIFQTYRYPLSTRRLLTDGGWAILANR